MHMPMGNARLSRSTLGASAALLFVLAVGCNGSFEDPGATAGGPDGTSGASNGGGPGGPAAPGDCSAPSPGTAPLRPLSNAEYRNTVRDLFANVSGFDSVITSPPASVQRNEWIEL